jgi:hypothetical protein
VKQSWLDAAEIFDAWRVVPRILLFAFAVWFGVSTDYLIGWYTHLPVIAQTTQASSFCFGVFSAQSAVAGYVFKVYTSGGRTWDMQPGRVSTLVSTETVTK